MEHSLCETGHNEPKTKNQSPKTWCHFHELSKIPAARGTPTIHEQLINSIVPFVSRSERICRDGMLREEWRNELWRKETDDGLRCPPEMASALELKNIYTQNQSRDRMCACSR